MSGGTTTVDIELTIESSEIDTGKTWGMDMGDVEEIVESFKVGTGRTWGMGKNSDISGWSEK